MKVHVTWILLLLAFTAKAQLASFFWKDDICENKGLFDSTKYSREQINAAYFLYDWDYYRIHNTPWVFCLEDVKKLRIDSLENEYREKKHKLLTLKLPDNKVWEKFRQSTLKEMEQVYNLSSIAYKAYLSDDLTVLNQFTKGDSCVAYYSRALIKGGDSLLEAWEQLTKTHAGKNGSPKRVWAKYNEERQSAERFQYAKIELLAFGWWNCAVSFIDRFNHDDASDDFYKLFVSTSEIECAWP